jgi:MFS family permease
MRTGQGVAIDVYGSRKVWLVSAATVVVCSAGHLLVSSADSPLIFALRIALQTGIAGFFGASISYVSGRAPVEHVVEVVGTLGTSGFIGTVLGTLLGDRLLGADKEPTMMFVAASTIGCLAFVFGLLATEGAQRPMSRRRPPLTWLLRRYHPGPMLLMGVAAGFGLGIPTIYVRPFSVELGIPGIAWFFFPYMAVAFTTRLSIRRMPARFGLRPVVLVGVLCLTLGMLSFVAVQKDWHFLLPALSMGIAHAIMFPTVVAGGSTAFPARYRGLGTTVMLATFDLGSFLAFVSVGAIIVQARAAGWPAYGTMFTCVAALLATSGIVYFRWSRPKRTI